MMIVNKKSKKISIYILHVIYSDMTNMESKFRIFSGIAG